MTSDRKRLYQKIENTRPKLQDLWNQKQKTDQEILKVGDELDKLMNEYSRTIEEKDQGIRKS